MCNLLPYSKMFHFVKNYFFSLLKLLSKQRTYAQYKLSQGDFCHVLSVKYYFLVHTAESYLKNTFLQQKFRFSQSYIISLENVYRAHNFISQQKLLLKKNKKLQIFGNRNKLYYVSDITPRVTLIKYSLNFKMLFEFQCIYNVLMFFKNQI